MFGIANYSRAGRTAANLDVPDPGSAGRLEGRIDGQLPRGGSPGGQALTRCPSPEIERRLGVEHSDEFGWRVQLERPELTVHVEMLHNHAFYFFGKEPGLGGLPTGASGRVVCLLSGGIDSPVAAWRVMRRGCTVSLVHFHGASVSAGDLAAQGAGDRLGAGALSAAACAFTSIAFGELQRQVVLAVPPALRVVVYRRLMLRIAEVIARREGARALVTGDVIGQVASQTIENLSVIESVATIPVLRPLIAFDKEEISAEAERIGTFPISIIPDEDCCTLFTPKHPVTRARRYEIETVEMQLPVVEMVRTAADGALVEEFAFPAVASPVR